MPLLGPSVEQLLVKTSHRMPELVRERNLKLVEASNSFVWKTSDENFWLIGAIKFVGKLIGGNFYRKDTHLLPPLKREFRHVLRFTHKFKYHNYYYNRYTNQSQQGDNPTDLFG